MMDITELVKVGGIPALILCFWAWEKMVTYRRIEKSLTEAIDRNTAALEALRDIILAIRR